MQAMARLATALEVHPVWPSGFSAIALSKAYVVCVFCSAVKYVFGIFAGQLEPLLWQLQSCIMARPQDLQPTLSTFLPSLTPLDTGQRRSSGNCTTLS